MTEIRGMTWKWTNDKLEIRGRTNNHVIIRCTPAYLLKIKSEIHNILTTFVLSEKLKFFGQLDQPDPVTRSPIWYLVVRKCRGGVEDEIVAKWDVHGLNGWLFNLNSKSNREEHDDNIEKRSCHRTWCGSRRATRCVSCNQNNKYAPTN